MLEKLLNHRTKNITSAAFIILITTLIAKILGLLRDRVLAGLFGAGDELDIYFAAFRIPDFLFNVLILGAISTAFIPVFAEYHLSSKEEALRLSNNVLCIFLVILIFLGTIGVIFAPQLMHLITPGFKGEKFTEVVKLTRIMFLSPILLGVSNIFGSILQYFSHFFTYSLAPIMYNLGIILGALFFVPKIGIEGLAWGVVLGAFLHLIIQLPTMFALGWRFKFSFDFSHKGTRKIFKLMVPRTIGLAASQINLIAITAIASLLSVGSIAVFNLANNLQYVPISLFGISFAVAIFPSLSRNVVKKEKVKFLEDFTSAFSEILFFALPVSLLFFLLRAQIVRIVLGTGQFSWQDTRLTAASLGVFTFSIFAQSLIPLLSRAFYAFRDTKTPVKIGIFSILINIALAAFFVWLLSFPNQFYYFCQLILDLKNISGISVIGLPLAFSLSSIINLIWLLIAFKKRVGNNWDKKLGEAFLRILLLSLICGGITFILLRPFSLIFDLHTFWGVFWEAALSGGLGFAFYLGFAKILKFPEYETILESFFKKK
ncbi:MAG TPA: murein biosynthesis integral membrane protein MurJ [Candidatus Pacearchaeota archaeon]|nr:murein biosynthesis integral membrane protein MurJ [Candidatus Pacearchaeota archaeon]HOK93988.1 murein biosynthesis integral membrane protein MurJ [Candidatus Pacearchaeota archaeon]HPO75059.1 murein biosynthesis integral membrane protein MurJ [Candidatus Pacearchaeota archaeon]